MHILLAYSTRHWMPSGEGANHLSASSAATLAKTLYNLLSNYGEVEYVDGVKPPKKLKRTHYDLMVGIQGSITPLSTIAKFDKKVLFAVNMHPAARNQILKQFNDTYSVCSTRHVERNSVHLRQMDDIEQADAVLLVGNATIAHSFMRFGTPLPQLRRFNYTSALPVRERPKEAVNTPPRLLYVATEMCLRKGFDILADMLQGVQDLPFTCGIVGGSGDADYRERLQSLKDKLGNKLTIHGWVDSCSPEYLEILRSYDVVLFPSLEEGQAGSVLDAMSQGLIPLITRETGVDFSPLGFLSPILGSRQNAELLRTLLNLDAHSLLKLHRQTLDWYRLNHLNWQEGLQRAVDALIHSGTPWPAEESYTSGDNPAMNYWKYEMVDKLEQAPELSAVAIQGDAPAARIRWELVDKLPENCVVIKRNTQHGPYLLGTPDENGTDILSMTAIRAESTTRCSWGTWLLRILSCIHPSKQKRKMCYNAWRLQQ